MGKAIYFLRDDPHGQWCGYASESRLKLQIQPLKAMVVGKVDYSDGRVSVVHLTETDETGDWAVSDEYTLDENGEVRGLKRTINILPEDTSEQQMFVIEKGKATKRRTTYRDLRTGRPTHKSADWFEPPPVITNLRAFPFWTLIVGNQQLVWSNEVFCVPGSPK
jgi:hypothetical protein